MVTFDESFVRNIIVAFFDMLGDDYAWYDSSDTADCTLLLETSEGPRPNVYLSYQTISAVPVGWGNRPVGTEYPQQEYEINVRVTAHGSAATPILFDAALRYTGDDVIDTIEALGAQIVGVFAQTVDQSQSPNEYGAQRIATLDITLGCTLVAHRVIVGAQTVTVAGSHAITFQMEDPP